MSRKKQEESMLGSQLDDEVLSRLRSKKSELKQREVDKEEEARQRRMEERKQREENKSFEELLNESELDWKSFKK